MATTTRPNGFPTLNMASSNKTNTQNLGSLSSSKWHNGIWGNIGGSINSHRDTTSSRGSDELSPTAPSGSAQLNSLAEPTAWNSRVWTPANTTPNNVSPTHTKNNFTYVYNESKENPSMYTARQSISQGTALSSRTMPPGPVDSPTSLRYNAVVGGTVNEERGSSGYYYLQNTSQLNSDAAALNRRNSTDPGFLGTGHNRPGAFSGRQPETNASTLASQFPESALIYPKGAHSNSEHQRPSISNASVSMASETTRGQAFTFSNDSAHTDFNEAFRRGMSLEDTMDSLNGYASNGYSNSAVQPFQPNPQPNPNSQPWQYEINNGSRNFSHGNQQDAWDIYNHVVEFCGDQHGSRFIQDKLAVANSEEKDHVFRELEPNALQLMRDVFGNYVIQKFFEFGNQVQKKHLASLMKGKVVDLSLQMYSCRVVQKALEHVLVEQQREIVEELRPSIVQVAKDQNGNHVIQKVVEWFPDISVPLVMEAFQGQIEHLAAHNYGCRVIQRILEYGTPAEKKRLMTDIHLCTAKLLTDQYGNYVIQHIISQGEPEDRSIIIRQVIDRALALSKHKYASNIVEKCIQFGTTDERNAICAKLTAQNGDGTNPLPVSMKDQYGNYVVQKMVEYLQGPEKTAFASNVMDYIPLLKKPGGGRQNAGLDRLYAAVQPVLNPSEGDTKGDATTAGTAPSTPNLAVEASSAVPTPSLTTEQNSPQSSSPPSTSISTIDETSEEAKTATVSRPEKAPSPVCVEEN
ncbi:hypothetical protein EKO27_g5237 [Xylaria grammica]|uniref:PUM-HD domain-containing protein n=1 Tax=Xylaria grammica TaxID=363999 RepID=A0A439D652_9PEZI|nr:hypothetical protein EKO27_g5237 [Xylaria grammica]